MASTRFDAAVIGSGPNGLAAAIVLARAGLHVTVLEAAPSIGGGTRTQELTLPGFHHDVCSAVHPMAVASPFFATLPMKELGLRWVHPRYALAHPLEHGPAVMLQASLDDTAADLGRDRSRYLACFEPFVAAWPKLAPALLAPFSPFPPCPVLVARFAMRALRSAHALAYGRFRTDRARALVAGLAAHSILPLDQPASAAVGLVLGATAHAVGWPIACGGSRRITDVLAKCLISLGGQIETDRPIASLEQAPCARVMIFDLTPRQILPIARQAMTAGFARSLERYRYGPGIFKLDLALAGPVPWRDPRCAQAGTVHVGGTFEEIASSEAAVFRGEHPDRPFVLVAQQSLFDDSRAPTNRHTLWAYCHVPHGSPRDMTTAIERQIERFAPGFRDQILARHAMNAPALEAYNANCVGGDINGGMQDLAQLFHRPASTLDPYHIPGTSMYICSSSTPPGGGVHGMCGYHAARAVIGRHFRHPTRG